MDKITDNIFIGDVLDASHPCIVDHVDVILNLSNELFVGNFKHPEGVESWSVPLKDAAPNDLKQIAKAIGVIESSLASGKKILVHCIAGISRSPSIVAAHLVRKHGWSLDEAIAFVKVRRAVARPHKAVVNSIKQYLAIK